MGQPTDRPPSAQGPSVLVVGAGPTGLSLAVGLAQQGVPVRVVDEELGPSQRTKAVILQPRSLEVFEDLGLVDAVAQEGLPLGGIRLHLNHSEPIEVGLDDIDSTYPFPLVLPQGRLEALLTAALADHGIDVEHGRRLDSLEVRAGRARATLTEQGGATEVLAADHIVGCDGRYSTTRDLAGIPLAVDRKVSPVVMADVRLAGDLDTDQLSVLIHDDGVLTLIPLPAPGRFRVQLLQAGEQAPEWAPTQATLQTLLDEVSPGSVSLASMTWAAVWHPDPAIASTFQKGPVLLAGDAAHTHTPLGAQGMNTGIQDAHALAWRLGHVANDQARGPELLATYGPERQAVAWRTARVCQRLDEVALGERWGNQLLREHLAPWLLGKGRVHARIGRWLSQTRIRYAASPLSTMHRAGLSGRFVRSGDLAAGDRLPDAVLGRPDGSFHRLHEEVSGPHHVLLLLAGHLDTGPDVQALRGCGEVAIDRLGAAVRVLWIQPRHDDQAHGPGGQARFQGLHAWDEGQIRYRSDPEAYLHGRLGAKRPSACLVRPDGHIAVIQHPPQPDALEAYLAGWYLPLPEPEPTEEAQAPAQAPPAPRLAEAPDDPLKAWERAQRRLRR